MVASTTLLTTDPIDFDAIAKSLVVEIETVPGMYEFEVMRWRKFVQLPVLSRDSIALDVTGIDTIPAREVGMAQFGEDDFGVVFTRVQLYTDEDRQFALYRVSVEMPNHWTRDEVQR